MATPARLHVPDDQIRQSSLRLHCSMPLLHKLSRALLHQISKPAAVSPAVLCCAKSSNTTCSGCLLKGVFSRVSLLCRLSLGHRASREVRTSKHERQVGPWRLLNNKPCRLNLPCNATAIRSNAHQISKLPTWHSSRSPCISASTEYARQRLAGTFTNFNRFAMKKGVKASSAKAAARAQADVGVGFGG